MEPTDDEMDARERHVKDTITEARVEAGKQRERLWRLMQDDRDGLRALDMPRIENAERAFTEAALSLSAIDLDEF